MGKGGSQAEREVDLASALTHCLSFVHLMYSLTDYSSKLTILIMTFASQKRRSMAAQLNANYKSYQKDA